MSQSKSDKPLAIKTIAVCIAVILIFHFAWSRQLAYNLKNILFTIIDAGLIGAFITECIGAYRYADDPNKEWKRYVAIGLTVAICLWTGGWAAGNNEKKAVIDDSNKAKQTSFIQQKNEPFHILTTDEAFMHDVVWLNNAAVYYHVCN